MRRSGVLIGIVAMALATVAPGAGAAQGDEPKSAAAKSALRKYEKVAEKAQQTYAREVDAARKAAAAELTTAMKAATRAANLDEANRIKAAIDGLKSDEPAAAAASPAKSRGGSGLVGAWQVVYIGGNQHVHEFREDGTVVNTFVDQAKWTAKVERDGDHVIAKYPQFTERYTVAGDRLFVEQFSPGSLYPNLPPSVMAVGAREERGERGGKSKRSR
jgi:hypothetical protein